MSENVGETDGTVRLKSLLAHLGALRQYSVGSIVYDQVARLVDEHAQVQRRIDQVYAQMLQLLLETYARDPSAEAVARTHARLINLRSSFPGAAVSAESGRPGAQPSEAIARLLRNLQQEMQGAAPAPSATAATTPPEGEVPPVVERRVDSSYRMQLERSHGEIEKLQQRLTQNVSAAITQNREFGALLEVELGALRQADGGGEIEQLREILIGGVEELLAGQRALDSRLHETGDYLKLVRSDSERLREELTRVRLLSLTDESTGLPNRRAFLRRLQDEIGRAQRYGTPLAIALLDLDGFKAINDAYGHMAGDEVLRCYAAQVLSTLRHHDLVARYGGEEFAILLPNTEQEGALAAISKIRNRAAEMRCEYEGRPLPIPTFSTGLTLYAQGDSQAALIERADRALYRAKNLGRNRVEIEARPVTAAPPSSPVESPIN